MLFVEQLITACILLNEVSIENIHKHVTQFAGLLTDSRIGYTGSFS